ncbi:MAG: BLUF domain-containing protein [Pseudomonadota bacterium]
MPILITLAYVSRSTIGGDIGKFVDLKDQVVARNRESGITGALLYDGQYFFQVLEGNYQTVTDLFARIRADDRHCECRELMNTMIHHRRFTGFPLKMVNAIANPDMAGKIMPDLLSRPSIDTLERRISDLAHA